MALLMVGIFIFLGPGSSHSHREALNGEMSPDREAALWAGG